MAAPLIIMRGDSENANTTNLRSAVASRSARAPALPPHGILAIPVASVEAARFSKPTYRPSSLPSEPPCPVPPNPPPLEQPRPPISVESTGFIVMPEEPFLEPKPGLPSVRTQDGNAKNFALEGYTPQNSLTPRDVPRPASFLEISGELAAQPPLPKPVPARPRPTAPTRVRIKKEPKKQTCRCRKRQCLGLYCVCFAAKGMCDAGCGCFNCKNNAAYAAERQQSVEETLAKNPQAFNSKFKVLKRDTTIQLHARGCKCQKTRCVKRYCECFREKTGCTRLCRCTNCANDTIAINDDEVVTYYERVQRKRRRATSAPRMRATGPPRDAPPAAAKEGAWDPAGDGVGGGAKEPPSSHPGKGSTRPVFKTATD